MVNRALLVGCNYPGTNAALNGCINDVWGTKNMLMTYYGFQESDIIVQIDTDPAYEKPTGRNMKTRLAELVAASQGDDVLVFHFSGHGTQIPGEAGCDESDGKDEAICPCDMNCITDDDLREILAPLAQKPGVKFTFIADCCHSGTLLDHQAVIITGPKEGGPPPPAIDVQGIQNMLAALGAGGKRDFKNRALPIDDLMGFLSNMLGSEVNRGNVRGSMTSIFGADASAKARSVVQYATMAQSALHSMTGGQRAPGGVGSVLSGLLGMCIGVASHVAGPGGAPNNTAEGAPQNGTVPVPPPHAGAKPPPGQQLPDEVGILITGCQDKETSADACPSGDKAKAHGALSNALHTVVKEHHDKNPGVPLTYRNMVIGVRDALAKTGFAQNPCLECSQKYADSPFVGHA